ncbi:MAG: MFS transporter [Planctomycetaceae bacterium]|jgi:inositol transporter-like SP family MFS transporter|nr:MFS transporter [Planctomycetaceae bacterium]
MSQPSTWTKTIVASMTSYIDAGSIVAGAAGLTLWQMYLGMENWQIGLLGACSSNALSAAIGALIGGRICDLYGRKLVYTYDLLFYIAGMLLIVFGVSYPMLLIGYIIVGFSVGADVAASWTLIAENAPAENRARHCGTAQLMWALGPAVVLFLSAILSFALSDPEKNKQVDALTAQITALTKQIETESIPSLEADLTKAKAEAEKAAIVKELAPKYLLGNRLVFGHLVVIAFLVWLMRLRMPESEEWKSNKEKEKELIAAGVWKKTSYWDLFTNPVNMRGILLLIGVYMIWNLAAGTGGGLMPYIYVKVGGVSTTVSQALTALIFGTSVFATLFIFMAFADKYSRRLIYCIVACLYIVAWGLLLLPKEYLGLGIFALASILMGINNGSGQQAFYQMWGAEMFPARYRAAAQGFSFFTARFCLSIWLYIAPFIIGKNGEGMAIAAGILVTFATISMLIGTIFCPNTAGKTLEQIEEERYGIVKS